MNKTKTVKQKNPKNRLTAWSNPVQCSLHCPEKKIKNYFSYVLYTSQNVIIHVKQKLSESADHCQDWSAWLQTVIGESLSKHVKTLKDSSKDSSKSFVKILLDFWQRYEPNCGKMPYLAMLKNRSKTPRSESRRGWLPKFNDIFLVQRYFFRKIFMKNRSVVFTWSC